MTGYVRQIEPRLNLTAWFRPLPNATDGEESQIKIVSNTITSTLSC